MKKILSVLMIALVMSLAVGTSLFAEGQQESADAVEEKGKVEIAYVDGWARGVACTHVVAVMLEEMGYDVSATPVANAAMWAALAAGDIDLQVTAWLPSTHGMYYGEEGKYTDQVDQVSMTYEGAALGLIVPQYLDVDSIPELVENADMFDGVITGIDPGAGMMQQTEKAIDANTTGLGAFELLEGSGATMLAALGDAYENEEPIVVTLWAPHWAFGRWDLKLLEDPDKIYGESENIYNMARLGLKDDMPEVYQFLKETEWLSLDLGSVMVWNEEGMDYWESARKFVSENKDMLNELLPEGMSL